MCMRDTVIQRKTKKASKIKVDKNPSQTTFATSFLIK